MPTVDDIMAEGVPSEVPGAAVALVRHGVPCCRGSLWTLGFFPIGRNLPVSGITAFDRLVEGPRSWPCLGATPMPCWGHANQAPCGGRAHALDPRRTTAPQICNLLVEIVKRPLVTAPEISTLYLVGESKCAAADVHEVVGGAVFSFADGYPDRLTRSFFHQSKQRGAFSMRRQR